MQFLFPVGEKNRCFCTRVADWSVFTIASIWLAFYILETTTVIGDRFGTRTATLYVCLVYHSVE